VPTSIGQWWRLLQEKTPHRALRYEDLDPPYDVKLVFVQKITFVLSKINKTAASRAALFDSNMHQIVSAGALPHTPLGLTALLQTSSIFRGPTSKGRGGRKFVLCHRKKNKKKSAPMVFAK